MPAAHRWEAPARGEVRISAELTRHDFGFQVRREGLSREYENTVFGTAAEALRTAGLSGWHVQLGKFVPQCNHVG
jgi:hypothetical protein